MTDSHVLLVGTSYRRASLELRERVRLDAAAAQELARELAAGGGEAVVLSTCNRTELYLADADPEAAARRAEEALARIGGIAGGAVYTRSGDDAVSHLFRVAAGLDSLVTGESQILGQVRTAFGDAGAAATVGPVLGRLFQQAVQAGKRVRTETEISRHAVSVPSVAVQLADDELGGLEGRRAVVVGTGRMAELVLLNLLHRSISSLVVCGRNPDRTERLAARFGAETVPLDRLGQELERADLIVAATGSPGVVLDTRTVSTAVRRRDGRPLLLLDLAVPRDVDPAVRIIDGCRLFDVDEIGQFARRSLGARRGESPRAEEIVAEEAASFFDWQRSLDVVPAIASLHRRAEDIRAGELARAEGRLAGLSPKERRVVESLTAQIVGKLLHAPTVRMKQAAAARDGLAYAHALQHLFALGEEA